MRLPGALIFLFGDGDLLLLGGYLSFGSPTARLSHLRRGAPHVGLGGVDVGFSIGDLFGGWAGQQVIQLRLGAGDGGLGSRNVAL